MIKDTQAHARERMQKAVESLRKDLQAIRTGRASAALVDHVRVDYYGAPTPISQLSTITVPESRLIVIHRGTVNPSPLLKRRSRSPISA